MPGTFSKSVRPKLPGAYFNFEGTAAAPAIGPSTSSVVALIGMSDWGPFKTPTLCTSLSDYLLKFGPSTNTQNYKAVRQAFQGEEIDGKTGAGGVIVYRVGSSAAAKATKTVANTTPATALTLTARYEGTYGNGITIMSRDYAGGATYNEIVVKINNVEVESHVYLDTNIDACAATINANSQWVTAVANITGTALNTTGAQDGLMTSGLDGTSPLAADITAAQDALETSRFGVICYADLEGTTYGGGATGTSLLAAHKTWAVNLNSKGRRFVTVCGGLAGEVTATATARSATLVDENFVNVGVGSVIDSTLGTLSTSLLAPRIAGILAAKGERQSLTFARLGGCTGGSFPTEALAVTAYDAGVTVLGRDSHPTAPVRIVKGLTTWTTAVATTNKPYLIYRNPKFVRTMHGIEMDLTEWAEQNVIGQIQVNDQARSMVVGEALRRLGLREDAGVIQPGSTCVVDSDPPAAETDEFIAIVYGIRFGRSVEQVFNTVRFA